MSKSTFSGTMYGHRLLGYTSLGPGLTGAYDDDAVRRSDLALFHDWSEAQAEAERINACEEMAPVEVVEAVVTVEIGG